MRRHKAAMTLLQGTLTVLTDQPICYKDYIIRFLSTCHHVVIVINGHIKPLNNLRILLLFLLRSVKLMVGSFLIKFFCTQYKVQSPTVTQILNIDVNH